MIDNSDNYFNLNDYLFEPSQNNIEEKVCSEYCQCKERTGVYSNTILDEFGINLEDLLNFNDLEDIMLLPGSVVKVPIRRRRED